MAAGIALSKAAARSSAELAARAAGMHAAAIAAATRAEPTMRENVLMRFLPLGARRFFCEPLKQNAYSAYRAVSDIARVQAKVLSSLPTERSPH
jgi:hypothetical protein